MLFFLILNLKLNTYVIQNYLFKEKQFKEWSKKARELRDSYNDEQIEDFKVELNKLSYMYWK